MKVGDAWLHTWSEDGEERELPVYGTPLDTAAIYDPRFPGDPKPYCDHQWASNSVNGHRFTFDEIHPDGIQPVKGKTFDH